MDGEWRNTVADAVVVIAYGTQKQMIVQPSLRAQRQFERHRRAVLLPLKPAAETWPCRSSNKGKIDCEFVVCAVLFSDHHHDSDQCFCSRSIMIASQQKWLG